MICNTCGIEKAETYFKTINGSRNKKCRLCYIKESKGIPIELHQYPHWITPFGKFVELKDASDKLKVSTSFLKKACIDNERVYTKRTNSSIKQSLIYKSNIETFFGTKTTYKQLGFSFRE